MNITLCIGFAPYVIFFIWLMFYGTWRQKTCPDCNELLPFLLSPFTKTKRQWIEGGYACQHCGCNIDNAGKKVGAGTTVSFSRLIVATGLLTFAVISAGILLTLLLRR